MKSLHKIVIFVMIFSFLITFGVLGYVAITEGTDVVMYATIGGVLLFYVLYVWMMIVLVFSKKFYKIEGPKDEGDVYVYARDNP